MERKENGKEKNELFNRMVKAGQRTYFITVKEASNNKKYVTLTESKLIEKDKFEHHNIMVFQEKIGEFVDALQGACAVAA
ncbi:MAG: DUF3276 family protein [Candidatus Margulisbacteria bacterium]|nr:DUF3276 family protein [Candidatus Margulisiibacteriota bacterium]